MPSPVAHPSGLLTPEWLKSDTGSAHMRDADAYDAVENVVKMAMLSWDTGTLAWVKFTGAGGGGGGGGAATIADGADVAQGARGDTAWDGSAASATGISIWKATLLKLEAIRLALAGTLTVGLPTGASTAARQDTGNTSIASIDTKTPALVGGRVPVDGSGVTQPISAAALPLPAGAATEAGNLATIAGKDFATQATLALVKAKTDNLDVAISTINGTDINAPTAMPAGGVGVRGWLSAIWTKLNGSLAVTGPATDTQLRATPLPVSGADTTLGATVTPKAASVWDVADRAARVLGVLSAGANVIGKVDQGTGGASAWKVDGSAVTQPVSIAAAVDISDRVGRLLGIVASITNALPAGTNKLGTVDIATAPATAKGVQGANGVPTQELRDAGRNTRIFMLDTITAAPVAEALATVVQWYGNAAIAGTTQPAVVPNGKTLRLISWKIQYQSLATVGYAVVRVRINTGGLGVLGSPLAFSFEAGSGSGATTVAMTGGVTTETGDFPEGFEIPAGAGVAFSVAGYGPTGTLTLEGGVRFMVSGYEY